MHLNSQTDNQMEKSEEKKQKKQWSDPEMVPMKILGGTLIKWTESFNLGTTTGGEVLFGQRFS
jgi:hypothetical protein